MLSPSPLNLNKQMLPAPLPKRKEKSALKLLQAPASADQSPVSVSHMWLNFTSYSVQDGEVDAEELQRCLTQSGFTGSYSRKCDTLCTNEDS